MNTPGKSFKDYLKDVGDVLNTPVHLPAFLTKPIPMPSFGRSKKRRRARIPNRAGEAAKASANPRVFILEGVLERGTNCKFSVKDTDFEIDANTWIVGSIEYGAQVKVKGQTQIDKRVATQIIILKNA